MIIWSHSHGGWFQQMMATSKGSMNTWDVASHPTMARAIFKSRITSFKADGRAIKFQNLSALWMKNMFWHMFERYHLKQAVCISLRGCEDKTCWLEILGFNWTAETRNRIDINQSKQTATPKQLIYDIYICIYMYIYMHICRYRCLYL